MEVAGIAAWEGWDQRWKLKSGQNAKINPAYNFTLSFQSQSRRPNSSQSRLLSHVVRTDILSWFHQYKPTYFHSSESFKFDFHYCGIGLASLKAHPKGALTSKGFLRGYGSEEPLMSYSFLSRQSEKRVLIRPARTCYHPRTWLECQDGCSRWSRCLDGRSSWWRLPLGAWKGILLGSSWWDGDALAGVHGCYCSLATKAVATTTARGVIC